LTNYWLAARVFERHTLTTCADQ